MSSPSTVLTLGYGSWGNVSLVLTLGYGDVGPVVFIGAGIDMVWHGEHLHYVHHGDW